MTKYYHEDGSISDSPERIPPKYEWFVTMEIAEIPRTVQADTAEEAMEKAELFWQLKEMDLDKLPRLICTSAQIQDVTNAYRDKMKIVTTVKDKANEDNFRGFLHEQPTWKKKDE